MKKNDDLFYLIKSLTKSEKRYFKLFARQAGDEKNYLLLFDAIEEQENYDEAEIYRRFSSMHFIKQLHVVKNYLYHLILKSIRVYTTAKNIEYKLQEAIRDADFLVEKGLYLQAKRILDKADELASEHEFYTLSLEILRRRSEIAREIDLHESSDKARIELLQRQSHIIKLIDNVTSYRLLSAKLLAYLNHSGLSRSEEDWKEIDILFNNQLLQDEAQALTDLSRSFFFHIRAAYYSARHRLEEAYQATKELVNLFERRADFMENDPLGYIYALRNHATDCFNVGHYDEVQHVLNRMNEVLRERSTPSINESVQVFKSVKSLEIILYIGMANFTEGRRVAKEVDEGIKKYQHVLDKNAEILFYYQLGLMFFYMQEYPTALKYVNCVINERYENMREDIYCFARILSLLLHYELGNVDLLDSMMRSTYTYLSKRKRIYKAESLIINLVKKLRTATTVEKLTRLFQQKLREAEGLDKDRFESNAYSYIDIVVWLRHKVQDKPMPEIITQRYKRNNA